ncbi:MarR family transcriptional regulator [Mycolicibacterium goodii]|uniref:MarR family winged helix-turn-helix transcriptional regulator n=1 Tax=Mycolicibacterium goodii TaxID=134601 RepID=UPI001BDCC441|nr:MarR family transcriptional regulator [Mycolicibacterium goodii]MBU8812493.1 MarR family transcriptional regulator [Mycolicibacterium goodii]ULN44908.1 MarR family transcriptional regulator [Mycolicibacterium goodii]
MTTQDDGETDLGWALHAVVRQYRRLTDDLLSDLPGGPRGYQVLMTSQLGPPRSQLALARYLGVDRTMMTYLLDDLEAAGLVTRTTDPNDRRSRNLKLTKKGRATLSRARRRLKAAEVSLLEPLDPDQQQSLRELLHQLANAEPKADN